MFPFLDDLDVHLNHTKSIRNTLFKSKMPLKHPKLTPKFWNKYRVIANKKLREGNIDGGDLLMKGENLKDRLLNQVLLKDNLVQLNNTFETRKEKNYSFYDGFAVDSNLPSKDIVNICF